MSARAPAGTAIGWLVVIWAGKRSAISPGPGITVWLASVVIAMVLRQVAGHGTAFSFIVVATLVLGAFLLGWRAAYAVWSKRRTS